MTESYKAENISVLGFSSGACLSLGIFLHNNATGRPLPMPGKIISVSPGGIPDVTVDENKEIWERVNALNHKDVMTDPTYIKTAREIAKGDEDIPEYMLDGTVGDFTGFPKTYFYFGENECLYAFAQTFKKAMEKYHVPYEIIVGKGMCHCYPSFRFADSQTGCKALTHPATGWTGGTGHSRHTQGTAVGTPLFRIQLQRGGQEEPA